jgi:ApbE superfamily uncharacterized protein (UPF0280 family)
MIKETDLWINAERDLTRAAHAAALACRRTLERYGNRHPEFLESLEPVAAGSDAPPLVRTMINAAAATGVGPMAAVAGAVAEAVGRVLLEDSPQVIVENGGDIFLASREDRVVSIYAGNSPFSERLAIRIRAAQTPVGLCTSSGTVGHSLSLGRSDAVSVLSPSTALADAAATAAGNLIQGPGDIQRSLDFLESVSGITGALVMVGDKLGIWGAVELTCPG